MTASLLRAIYNKTRSFPNYVDFNTYDELSFITIHYQSAIYTTMTDLKNFPSSFN